MDRDHPMFVSLINSHIQSTSIRVMSTVNVTDLWPRDGSLVLFNFTLTRKLTEAGYTKFLNALFKCAVHYLADPSTHFRGYSRTVKCYSYITGEINVVSLGRRVWPAIQLEWAVCGPHVR